MSKGYIEEIVMFSKTWSSRDVLLRVTVLSSELEIL